jgi:uncharacterized protein (TIGR02266 family)
MSRKSKKRRHQQRPTTEPGSVARLAAAAERPSEPAARVVGAVLHAITESLGVLDDHRTYPRVLLHVDIDLHSESHFFSGLSGDVSEGGLFVQTYRPLKIGDEVDIAFELDGERVEARAVVRWHREGTPGCGPGFGLSFDALTERERAIVHGFCEKRAPLYYEV